MVAVQVIVIIMCTIIKGHSVEISGLEDLENPRSNPHFAIKFAIYSQPNLLYRVILRGYREENNIHCPSSLDNKKVINK